MRGTGSFIAVYGGKSRKQQQTSTGLPSGIKMQLESDKGVTVPIANVTLWEDQSGNGNDATQSGGSGPTVVANQLNGYSVLRFNGTSQSMTCGSSLGLIKNINGATIICVAKIRTLQASAAIGAYFSVGSSANTARLLLQVDNPTSCGFRYRIRDADAGNNIGTASMPSTSDFIIHGCRVNYIGGTGAYYQGETVVAGPSALLRSEAVANTDSASVLIGALGSVTLSAHDYACVYVWDRCLTEDEYSTAVGYLKSKYGL